MIFFDNVRTCTCAGAAFFAELYYLLCASNHKSEVRHNNILRQLPSCQRRLRQSNKWSQFDLDRPRVGPVKSHKKT